MTARTLFRCLAALAGIGAWLAATEAAAQGGPDCAEEAVLTRLLQARCPALTTEPAWVLTFDHRQERWSNAYRVAEWTPRNDGTCQVKLTARPADLKRTVERIPLLRRTRSQKVLVVVTQTNPMLFSARLTESTERDIPELADLQRVSALVAGVASRALAVTGSGPLPKVVDTVTDVPEDTCTAASLADVVRCLSGPAAARIKQQQDRANDLKTAAGGVTQAVARIESDQRYLTWYLQRMELGQPISAGQWLESRQLHLRFGESETAFGELGTRVAGAVQQPAQCLAPYGTLADALTLLLSPVPAPQRDAIRQRYVDDLASLEITQKEDCPGGSTDREVDAFREAGRLLRAFMPGDSPAPPAAASELLRIAALYGTVAAGMDKAVKAAQDLLEQRGKIAASAASLDRMAAREKERRVRAVLETCPDAGLLDVAGPEDVFRWNKIVRHGFTLEADAVGAAAVHTARPAKVKAQYELEPRLAVRPTVSFGITHTPLDSPTFGVRAAGDGKKYIVRTREDSRSGLPVAFVTLQPVVGARLPLGVDLGVGLDTAKTAFFTGLSLKVPGGRIGGGYTWQEITALNPGQDEALFLADGELDPESLRARSRVSDAAEIRTRTVMARDWYLSLSISIDSLPFFKPKQ